MPSKLQRLNGRTFPGGSDIAKTILRDCRSQVSSLDSSQIVRTGEERMYVKKSTFGAHTHGTHRLVVVGRMQRGHLRKRSEFLSQRVLWCYCCSPQRRRFFPRICVCLTSTSGSIAHERTYGSVRDVSQAAKEQSRNQSDFSTGFQQVCAAPTGTQPRCTK